MAVCDATDPVERRFALRLLQDHAYNDAQTGVVRGLLADFVEAARRLATSGDYTDLRRLALVLGKIGEERCAAEIEAMATAETGGERADNHSG